MQSDQHLYQKLSTAIAANVAHCHKRVATLNVGLYLKDLQLLLGKTVEDPLDEVVTGLAKVTKQPVLEVEESRRTKGGLLQRIQSQCGASQQIKINTVK